MWLPLIFEYIIDGRKSRQADRGLAPVCPPAFALTSAANMSVNDLITVSDAVRGYPFIHLTPLGQSAAWYNDDRHLVHKAQPNTLTAPPLVFRDRLAPYIEEFHPLLEQLDDRLRDVRPSQCLTHLAFGVRGNGEVHSWNWHHLVLQWIAADRLSWSTRTIKAPSRSCDAEVYRQNPVTSKFEEPAVKWKTILRKFQIVFNSDLNSAAAKPRYGPCSTSSEVVGSLLHGDAMAMRKQHGALAESHFCSAALAVRALMTVGTRSFFSPNPSA